MARVAIGALLLWFSVGSLAAAPNIAFFYGSNAPWDELQAFDIVVVEADHNIDVAARSTPRTQLFAYVSVGEVGRERAYFKDIPAAWLIGDNRPWNASVVDQAAPGWPQFFVERVIAPRWKAGYRGFFLDTLDSYQIVAKTDEQRARQEQGLIAVVQAIRARFPEAKLIFNRGFEILPQVHRDAYAVAVESIFSGWSAARGQYVDVSESERKWIFAHLDRVKNEYRLPVIAIDYVPSAQRDRARDIARRLTALGYIPWVSSSDLDQMGVGAIEVMPRKVLMLYDSGGNELSLMDHRIHRLATMPLNYLGYTAEYLDIRQPLPAHPLVGRYAGIVTWFLGEEAAANRDLRGWLVRQREQGMRLAVLGTFGVPLTDSLVRSLGLVTETRRALPERISVDFRDPLVGFEAQPLTDRRTFVPLRAQDGKPLLRLRSDSGETMDAAALMPWGGYVLAPYELLQLPGDAGNRWVIHPIDFMRRALALPAMPVPDVTTENGRRLMLVHIDGDGLVNRAELLGTPFAGEVLLRNVLQKYRIPHAVSIIQGEIAPNGLYPRESPELEAITRKIFALPHVELASHTHSHPFQWSEASTQADPEAYHLKIPGYKFNLDAEIFGSIDYINSRLAPPGKKTRLFFWSGDTNPPAAAVAMTYRAGVLNLNGGDTTITRMHNTMTRVAPVGLQKGQYFQIYAPNQNENVYTNLWTGPFYGYERAIETFELTDQPYRLKPINVYYHVYSASKRASLSALDKVYGWALAQPVMNIYPSEYAQKVLDFNRAVVARSGDDWIIRTHGALRELRAPAALGTPDVAASSNVAGYNRHGNEHYVHVADGEARLRFTKEASRAPYLVDANARIEKWQRDGSSMQFSLNGHVPVRFSLANAGACRVTADGRPLTGTTQAGITRYELKRNGGTIQASCAS